MNRHFVNYYPDDTVLGTPIRREEPRSLETPWVPTDTPGYVRRINSEGMPEVSHVDNLPPPTPEPFIVKLSSGELHIVGSTGVMWPKLRIYKEDGVWLVEPV